MANEKTPVVWDDTTNKHRPLGTGEKMGGLDASSLLSSDSGNLLEAGSDGLAYLSGSGMVDPRADNLLEDSANGKLQVTVDRIAEWLDGHPQDAAALADAMNVVSTDAGNLIVQGTDKGAYLSNAQLAAAFAGLTDAQKAAIAAAVAEKMAAQLADGQTITASGGKLHADPTNATVAQKTAISSAISSTAGGLVVNPSTGRLEVDFGQMPTDKFEDLLKGLKMQIPLDADLSLYVDNQSDGDSLVDGRGTQAKPFKTLQACVTYATQTFALGRFNIYIYVAKGSGVYSESVVCPVFTSSSGRIIVRAADYGNPPIFVNPGVVTTPMNVSGGSWVFRRINFSCNFSSPNDGLNHFPFVFHAMGNATTVEIAGCGFSCSYAGSAPAGGNTLAMRIIGATSGASLSLSILPGYRNSFDFSTGQASRLEVIIVENSSSVTMPDGNIDDAVAYTIPCSGTCTTFLVVAVNSTFYHVSGGLYKQQFSGASVVGRPYSVSAGSGVVAPVGGFPGDGEPVVDAPTYSWYKQSS